MFMRVCEYFMCTHERRSPGFARDKVVRRAPTRDGDLSVSPAETPGVRKGEAL